MVGKFDRCSWQREKGGPPILRPVLAWFVGTIIDRVPRWETIRRTFSSQSGTAAVRVSRPFATGRRERSRPVTDTPNDSPETSSADLIRQIGHDERIHKEESEVKMHHPRFG